ncbi:hypothetical protein SAMN05421788_101278 [Filimonas lacunae]|uniref:Uncharacterized protein n=1 Tax=Filimonas lacunae TaxID=477680 RepID=A0A173MMG6_9BACT|nr:hypothetical protein [Filimonas lacunae]BAV08824.1 hypothetical protein FLA_4871 [Filimonas lacunae]SIS62324.1 hypothetical protein SAMN05421788_101278 [Filimonas lacunae]
MKGLFAIILLVAGSMVQAQKITYSEPDRDDVRNLNFEVIGKMNGHFLVYKGYRDNHSITAYDDNMKVVEKHDLDFIPNRSLNVDFINYKDYSYLFYQYQKKSIVFCMVARLDADGKLVGQPVILDTTEINYSSSKKLYTLINSEDKQRIGILKINSKNDRNHLVTLSLFGGDLSLLKKGTVGVPMEEKNSFINEFVLSNDGDLAFLRPAGSSQNDNITQLHLLVKRAQADSLEMYPVDLMKLFMDDIRLKVDNVNKHYLVTSFFSKSKRGNIDGLYCSIWDKNNGAVISNINTIFSDEFRNDAKGDGSTKTAFNDYFLQNIVMRKDGGYVISAESVYTSARNGANNRWDYMNGYGYGYGYGYPYMSPYNNYYYANPFSNYYYPWGRYGGMGGFQVNRYFADNVAILSFDSTGNMEWANTIRKSQYDDNTDNYLGYGTMRSGNEIHFIFNQLEKRNLLLTDQSITADGQLRRSPTFKNLDKGYNFMPRFAKQVSSWEMIVPCEYRNYICFAKVEF